MSVARINAIQFGVAALFGALACVVGMLVLERETTRQQTARSAELFANAAAHRLDGAMASLTRAVELTILQGGVTAGADAPAAIERWARSRPSYAAVFLVTPAGRVAAASLPRLIGQDLSYEPWFDGARSATTIAEASFRNALSQGEGAESIVASPIRDARGALQGIVVVVLGERWFSEILDEVRRSALGVEPDASLAVLSSSGTALYRSGKAIPAGQAAAVQVSARTTAPTAITDWTTIVRVPETAAGGIPAIPMTLVQALLATVVVAGLVGWLLGRVADRKLARLFEPEPSDDTPTERAGTGWSHIAQQAAALRDAQSQAVRAIRDSRTAQTRIYGRLHAFEALSGWTYWSIDLAQGHATWTYRAAGATKAIERTMPLEAVTAYVMPEDRDLLDLTLQAASEGDGIHDIELRLAGAGRDGRRLLVRVERSVDAQGRGHLLHALTREVGMGVSGSAQQVAPADPSVPERRHASSLLRPVVDSIVFDLNDMLTVAICNLDALRDKGADGTALDRTMRALARGAGLTSRMVSFVRQRIPSLHNVVVREVIDGMRPFITASLPPHVPFLVELPTDLPPVRCSERQLELALMNLVMLAHSRGAHGSRIRLRAESAGSQVRIVIEAEPVAHGHGERPEGRMASAGAENGIAAVTMLVSQVSGRLIEREQQGAPVFELLLPAGELDVSRRPSAPATQASARILLVNGDPLMRATLSDALAEMGHRVEEARSGADALARLGKASFDVLVADQNLPVMSGLQLAATAFRAVPSLKIVITSVRGQVPRSADAFLLLDKPFGRAELAHVLSLPMPARALPNAA